MKAFDFARRSLLAFLLLGGLVFLVCGCERAPNVAPASGGLRIVSTAPSITETLFALGLDDCVVAVSDYCKYPERAKELPKIGSLYEYNVERIVELEPDFVVVLKENEVLPPRLTKLGIEAFQVDHTSLEGVFESFEDLGARCEAKAPGSRARGERLRREQERRIADLRAKTAPLAKPRVLISIYRELGLGKISEAYIAGDNPFFNSAVEIAGGENVGRDLPGVAPTASAEGIISLNPEVVLDLSTDGVERTSSERARESTVRTADWDSLGTDVAAVRDGRIYQIFEDYATVPGPRAILFIEDLARLLHPELAEPAARSRD